MGQFKTDPLPVLGLAVGLPVAWWISRGFGALLFQVRPGDLSTYVVVAAALIVVGLTAAAFEPISIEWRPGEVW